MKNTKNQALDYYRLFSEKEGCQHIAGAFALQTIINIIKRFKPKSILEVGLGIGSISYTILDYYKNNDALATYVGTENNEFCLSALDTNLSTYKKDVTIFSDIENVPSSSKFDLIIIDGSDSSLENVKDKLTKNAIIFIEGGRSKQVNLLRELFPNHLYSTIISNYKNPDYGPFEKELWSGGGQIIFINPTLKQKLFYLYVRLRTSFIYKVYRKLYK